MNAYRLCLCQAGLNSPYGLIKEDKVKRDRRDEKSREKEVDSEGEDQKENETGINIQPGLF